jgi:hypothetical protein
MSLLHRRLLGESVGGERRIPNSQSSVSLVAFTMSRLLTQFPELSIFDRKYNSRP